MSVAAPAMAGPTPRARLSPVKMIAIVAVALIVLLTIAFAVIALQAPPEPKARCENPMDCEPVTVAEPLIHGHLFTGDLGHEFQFSDDFWTVTDEGPDHIEIQEKNGAPLWIRIEAIPASEEAPKAFLEGKLDDLSTLVDELAEVTDADLVITNPGIGNHHGVGGFFAGTLSAQGQSVPVAVAAMSATDGDVTVSVLVIAGRRIYEPATQLADSVLNTFLYPSQTDG